jgi:hypothetical protein
MDSGIPAFDVPEQGRWAGSRDRSETAQFVPSYVKGVKSHGRQERGV